MNKALLMTETLIRVRFSDVDSMGVVWHGKYIKYFEDGREDFGKKFGIGYLDFFNNGILVPVVKLDCSFKKPLRFGDTALVETRFIDSDAAKTIFEYVIYNEKTREIVASGSTTQVFMDLKHKLLLNFPAFFLEWKNQLGLG
ncbi:MAG: acyl-CoA thioesterase [Bacteroidales bacterium]